MLERRKGPEAEPTEVTGRHDPSPTMTEEGYEGGGGWTEERTPTSGAMWKEAPESAIQSVPTGGACPRALRSSADGAGIHPIGIG
jgi:hypothetical protein